MKDPMLMEPPAPIPTACMALLWLSVCSFVPLAISYRSPAQLRHKGARLDVLRVLVDATAHQDVGLWTLVPGAGSQIRMQNEPITNDRLGAAD